MAACPDPFEATGGWVSNRKVLVCIAGAPGSGKSTLCEALCQQIDNCVTLSVDEAFDSLQLEQQGKASPTGDASVLALHAAAERVQRACKRLLEDPGANVILIDDTLHLPSMRKPFFQMAREGGHKFITLALYTPLTDIKARLKARSVLTAAHSHVSLASAAVMHAAMSTAATKDWEMPHIHTQHSNGDRHALVAKAEELIRNARVPKELVVVHTPEPTAASASKRHIADQFMRKFIGRCMVKVANDLAGATPQACAAVLKQLKASALDDAEFVSSPSLSHLYLLLESDPISSTAAGSAVLLQLRQQPAAE